ncbi:MAG: phospholipase [Chloroflexi bacterium]|nr:MAG: phospholipase [Chloroflexota bacterium]MBL1196953.1 phospholipase [Chloroflexota bacterium]NOH14249.1 phospholipase [Chloroflexota bacterium]
MKRISLLFLALIALLTGCQAAAPETPSNQYQTGVHLQAQFEVPDPLEGFPPSHEIMNYLLWLPEGFGEDPDKKWPLIYFLHGSGDAEYDSTFVMSYGLPEVLLAGDQPEDFPFVVVSPQTYPNIPWWGGDVPRVLNALLDDVIERYQIDEQRMYLTGLSMGGYGSWFQASLYPGRFAALVSISGSGYRTPQVPPEEFLCSVEDVPAWVIHGATDNISEPFIAEQFAMAYRDVCGAELQFTMYDDVGHFGAYHRAYRDPALYEWLLEHTLPQQP